MENQVENLQPDNYKSSLNWVKMPKEPAEDNDENFDSNIQLENNNIQTKIELEYDCRKEHGSNWKENENDFNENSTISNQMNKVDELENTNIPDQKHSSAGVDNTNLNKNKEKVVKNEIKVSVINASQATNSHVVHIPTPLRYFQFTSIPVAGLIPALALTSLTAQQGGMMGHDNMNWAMQLQPAGANTTNGFHRYIPGLGNMQVISAVQPIVQMWQPAAFRIAVNYIEPHQSIIHPWIIQPNGNIVIPQPTRQLQPAFQVHEQAPQTLQQSQHNVSTVSNEGTTETIDQQSSKEQLYQQQSAFQVHEHAIMDVVKVNSIKQLRSAGANIDNGVLQSISGFENIQLNSTLQPKLCQWKPVQVQQAPQSPQHSQHNVSTASSEDTLGTTKMYQKRAPCPCLNCMDSNGNRSTSGKREHICHIPGCSKVYSKTSHLLDHLRRHTGERPYVCNWESCGKTFSRSHELRRHNRYHTGEWEYQCPKCAKKYKRADHLFSHSKTHKKKRTTVSNVI